MISGAEPTAGPVDIRIDSDHQLTERRLKQQGDRLEQLGEEMLAELDTTIDVSPSDRQVALEQAVTLAGLTDPDRAYAPISFVLEAADRFHAWLTQDQEPTP